MPWWMSALACNDQESQVAPVDWAAPGPYGVGYREEQHSLYDPVSSSDRSIPVAVWYPTEDETGAIVSYQGLFDADGVLGDAEPAAEPTKILVFSHGHQAYAQASSFLMEHFASHGWWVYALDHLGNTTFDPPERETAIYVQRPWDVASLAAEISDAAGIPVVLAGHSFGGYTIHGVAGARYDMESLLPGCYDGSDTSEFCSTMTPALADLFYDIDHPKIEAVISMAPGDWRLFGDGLAEVAAPVMLMTGGLDPGTDGDPIWSDLDGADDIRVHLPEAGHNTFTDFSGILDGPGVIDPEEGFTIIRRCALAFAEAHLGDTTAYKDLYAGDIDTEGVELQLR